MVTRDESAMKEKQLAIRLRQQDMTALAELMDLFGHSIYRTALLLLKDIHLAEDMCQEVFIKAYRRINQYSGKGSLHGWLLSITMNQCRAWMRKSAWKRLLFQASPQTDVSRAHKGRIPNQHPENCPEQKLLEHAFLDQLQQLPYRYREVIILHYYHDMSVEEIGRSLHEKEGTVKSKLHRGRKLLRDILEEGEWQHG